MLGEQINLWILYFFIYSVLGWICETIYCSVGNKKFEIRGFLYGPYCPIYGFGAVILLRLLLPLHDYPVAMFFVGLLACSVLEYFTSWIMEKLFNMRWWDYSKKKFNINGRVCLLNAVLFGVGGMIIVYLIQPEISKFVEKLTSTHIRLFATLIMAVLLIDFVASLASTLKFSSALKDAQQSIEKFKEEHPIKDLSPEKLLSTLRENAEKAAENHQNTAEKAFAKLKEISLENIRNRRVETSSSTMGKNGDEDALEVWRAYAKHQKELLIEKKKSKKAELVAERKKARESNVFGAGLGFDKIFWVFMIASVLGYIVEVLFSYATKGDAESCQGLLYGPISQVYGLGAVLLTVSLYKYTKPEERGKNNDIEIFLTGAIVGGAFEVLCSWVEQKAFGFISWYYSPKELGIFGGRTSLIFMIFWGLLSVVFIKKIYPAMSDLIEKTPRKAGKRITTVVFILLMADVILTIGAVYRFSRRQDDIKATTSIGRWLDETYPNKKMEDIFPGMKKESVKKAEDPTLVQ